MSTAIAAYLIAAAMMLRWNLSSKDAAKRAADLWRDISEHL